MQDHKDYFILIKKKNRLYICGAAQESKHYIQSRQFTLKQNLCRQRANNNHE